DYFVFFQHPRAVEAFGRAILEALASGIVVILPKHFFPVFAEAALYAEPSEVQCIVDYYNSDFGRDQEQLKRAWSVLKDRFSYSDYQKRIKTLLETGSPRGTIQG